MLESAIAEATIEQYSENGQKVNYENLIGYNGILQEKVPQIENWVEDDILTCHNYYFQITSDLQVKAVNFDTNYKCVAEMKADKDNLSENDIVSTLAYYENGKRSGGGIYLITSNIGDLTEDDGRVIKINNSDLYAVLQLKGNGVNAMQYGCYGDGVTDDTTRLQKLFDMIYKDNGGTVYFPEGTYIVKIQENTGYSKYRSCLTLLGGNTNLVGSGNSEIKEIGFNGGDLSDDYFYDESVSKYYRGHLLMFGSKEEPINENITIKNLNFNGGATTMPSYTESALTDGSTPSQWDITHKGIIFYNDNEANRISKS